MQSELNELIQKFPHAWESVKAEILPAMENKNFDDLKASEVKAHAVLKSWDKRIKQSHNNPQILALANLPRVESRMKILCIQDIYETLLRRSIEGDKPLSFKNRWISNFLFFVTDLKRKPVSLNFFKCLWPFVSQKGRVLSLVNEVGIYGFFSSKFIDELIKLIGVETALEIAAGDGTLTRFLHERGVPVVATDDYSWKARIKIPEFVEKIDAVNALRKHPSKVVLCSWPPPDNSFEKEVFKNPSVELYILITSRHQYAAGNWSAYKNQNNFLMTYDAKLSALIVPKECDSAVYLFKRTS